MRVNDRVTLGSLYSELRFASVTTMLVATTCYAGPCYDGIRLFDLCQNKLEKFGGRIEENAWNEKAKKMK